MNEKKATGNITNNFSLNEHLPADTLNKIIEAILYLEDKAQDNYDANLATQAKTILGAINELASEKQDTQATVSQSAPSEITLADNTVYYLTNVSSLTLTYPQDTHWECLLQVETASSGTVTITLPNTTKFIGDVPTFDNDEVWEISIRDGIVVCGKAVSAS